jgi:hypothetical protein
VLFDDLRNCLLDGFRGRHIGVVRRDLWNATNPLAVPLSVLRS